MTLGLRQRCGRVWWGMWFRVEKKKEGGGQKKRGRTFSSWPRVVLTFCCGFCEEGDVDTSYEKKPCPKIQYLPDAPEIIKKNSNPSVTDYVRDCMRSNDGYFGTFRCHRRLALRRCAVHVTRTVVDGL